MSTSDRRAGSPEAGGSLAQSARTGESSPRPSKQNRGLLSLRSFFFHTSRDHATSAKSPCDRGVSIQFTPDGPVTGRS
jgi:hypothetical protein